MTPVDQYVTDARSLVRWWVGSLGAVAAVSLGSLSISDSSGLETWARAAQLLIIGALFVISVVLLLSTGHLFVVPRAWAELTVAEQDERLQGMRVSRSDLEEWMRSVQDRGRADDVVQRIVEEVRLDECEASLGAARRRIGLWAGIAGVLVLSSVLLRSVPVATADDCPDDPAACEHLAVTQTPRTVEVVLAGATAGEREASRTVLSSRLGGSACTVPDAFSALLIGGDYGHPVVTVELSGCDRAWLALDPALGAVVGVAD